MGYSSWDQKTLRHDLAAEQQQSLCISHWAEWSILSSLILTTLLCIWSLQVNKTLIWVFKNLPQAVPVALI